MRKIDLRNFFLVRDVKDGYLEHVNGEITVGFKLGHLPYGITSPETQKSIWNYINDLLKTWVEGTWVQKQDFFWERFIKPDANRHYSDVSIENMKYYSMRETMGHASFVYVTFTPDQFKHFNLKDSQFVRMMELALNPVNKSSRKKADAMIKGIVKELQKGTNGFRGKLITKDQWAKIFYAYYTGNYNLENWDVPEVLDLGNFQVTEEGYLQRENVLFSNVFMGVEPQGTVPLWDRYKVASTEKNDKFVYNPNEKLKNYSAFPITAGLPFAHCTTVTLQKVDKNEAIKEVNKQMKLNTLGSAGAKGVDPDSMDKEEKASVNAHAERLKSFLSDSEYPPCTYGVSITIPSHSKQALSEKTEVAKGVFTQYAAKGEFHRAHNMPMYFASAPGHGHNGHDMFIGQSANAVPFININSYRDGDKSGILFKDPTTGHPMNFEPWDNPLLAGVRNGQVDGPTRSGKSVTVANECDYYVNNNYHQVIVEKGRSFEWLALIYDAEYIDLQPGSDIGIDLFDYNPARISELQKSIIVSVITKMYPKWDENVLAGVTHLLEQYNQHISEKGQDPSFNSFYDFYVKVYMKSKSVYAKHMDFELFESELKRFVHGTNKWLFNNEKSIKINHIPFVIFELKALESSPLYNLAIEAILGLINNKMEYWNRSIRLVIKIDEALQPFKNKHSSKLLEEFYTQVGKFNAGITIMVQSIGLIKELPAWTAVEANTQLRIYGYNAHLDGWAEREAELLNWNHHRYSLVKNLRSDTQHGRESLWVVGEEEMIVCLQLSPIANYVFSTTAEVRKGIEKLKLENPNRGLKELIFEDYYRRLRKKVS